MKKAIKNSFYKINPRGGISLIVLVITIIVVIILAAAVIISLQNNNPMVEASEARIKSDVANMQLILTNTVGKIMAENQEVVMIDKAQLNTVTSGAKKVVGTAVYKIKGTDGSLVIGGQIKFESGEKSGTTYYTGKELPLYSGETKWYIDEQGLISVNVGGTKYGEGEQVEGSEEDEVIVGEKVTESAKEFTDANGETATIPIGFAVVPGKNVISDGLVISDLPNDTLDEGNQFVWVPVNDISTFKTEIGYTNNGALQTKIFSVCSEPLNYESTKAPQEQLDEYNKMKASVEEYHGFYIGRYEISNDGSGNVQSKKNKMPWSGLDWGNSMTNIAGGIVEKARAMYKEEDALKGDVVSTLIYGTAWDETVRFIKKKYPGIEKNSEGYGNYGTQNEDGNFVQADVIPTGSEEKYSLNNIYDMAGNLQEWTMQSYYDDFRVLKGGSIKVYGFNGPISVIQYDLPKSGAYTSYGGGRIQLYIK